MCKKAPITQQYSSILLFDINGELIQGQYANDNNNMIILLLCMDKNCERMIIQLFFHIEPYSEINWAMT